MNSSLGSQQWPTAVSDQYEASRLLGQGAWGSVTLATSKDAQRREVAIKVVGAANCPKKEHGYARREIDILKELNHPYIVRLLDSWETPMRDSNKTCAAAMALSYARGPTLAKLVGFGGAVGLEFGRVVTAQLVDAVAYLHGRAVCHRDIKPANIIVTCPMGPAIWRDHTDDEEDNCEDLDYWKSLAHKYHVTLVDFGFARALSPKDYENGCVCISDCEGGGRGDRISYSHAVKRMTALGTQRYCAPEIFEEAYEDPTSCTLTESAPLMSTFDITKNFSSVVANYGVLVDAYALGNTLRYMMTGVQPDQDVDQVVRRQRNPFVQFFARYGCTRDASVSYNHKFRTWSELPQQLAALIQQSCHRSPSQRLSVRAFRRSSYVCTALGPLRSSDDIDYLSFTLKSNPEDEDQSAREAGVSHLEAAGVATIAIDGQ